MKRPFPSQFIPRTLGFMRQMFRRTGIAPFQLCNSSTVVVFDHQRLWTPGHSHTRKQDLTVAGQWVSRSCTFVTCLPDTRVGGNGSPNFRHKGLPWLNNFYKPAWVDAQVTVSDTRIRGPAWPTSNQSLLHNPGRPSTLSEWDVTARTVSRLCEKGELSEAVETLRVLVQTQYPVSTSLLYSVIRRCAAEKNLVAGRRIHDLTVKLGFESNAFLGNHILRMYASQGRLQEALDVFARVAKPDAFMWSSIISAHAKHGKPRRAIQLYHEMRSSGVKLDSHVSVAALQACAFAADLDSGRQVHNDVLESGIPLNSFVCSSLVDMYAKCGKLDDARRVFDSLTTKTVVTWNAMIAGYADLGLAQEALALHGRMEQEGLILADGVTFACLLKACVTVGDLQQGKQLHSQILDRGHLCGDIVVGNHLVDMYAKCGELEEARKVFDTLTTRDVVTWNAMISGYAKHGLGQEALALCATMEQEDLVLAQGFTLTQDRSRAIDSHRDQHEMLWGDSRQDKVSSQSSSRLRDKKSEESFWLNKIFKHLTVLDTDPARPARSTTLLDNPGRPSTLPDCEWDGTAHTVSRLCEHGKLSEAVDALSSLVEIQSRVSTSLLYSVIKRCVAENNLVVGQRLYDLIVKLGFESNAFLGNHILRMYASQGWLEKAMDVFTKVAKPDVFMWFSIISAHAKHGKPGQAIQLYHEMRSSGLKPNGHVFVAAMQACAIAADLDSGKQVHNDVLESGVLPNSFVCNSLVDMYAKCGQLDDARRVFDSLATRTVVTWTTMIGAYGGRGFGQEALALYARMEQEGLILADGVTFACLLKACASVGALQQGRELHSQILKRGQLEGDIVLGNCLVDMYAKCGKLEDARRIFDSLAAKDVVTWNAMITGYGRCNESHRAIACFEEMLVAGFHPNGTTFSCLLIACSHEGLVNEGRRYFNAMVEHHGLTPTIWHYNCMIDLLGRAGHMDEAENMLLSCESKNDAVGLMSLLNACGSHGDIERGTRCFESLVRLDPQHAAAYVLMANLYADAGRWTDVDRIESLRKSVGANKKPAVAGIEVNKQVHTFVVGEDREDILCKVRSTNVRLEEGGHVPDTKLVLKPLSDKEKEDELCGHAEKLALAYGLLNTPDGTPLLVTKNLRMCRDCHSATEIMSMIEKRDIVVRDAHRVHRFVAGCCSCKGRP